MQSFGSCGNVAAVDKPWPGVGIEPGRNSLRLVRLSIAVVVGLLAFNLLAGFWLRLPARGTVPSDPDVLYLVAGAKAQAKRIESLARLARKFEPETRIADAARPEIWIGNDFEVGLWSSSDGRNLTRAEWAAVYLRNSLGPMADNWSMLIVPGRAWGTDGEMASLAAELTRRRTSGNNSSLDFPGSIVLVTSPSHVRRTVARLRNHADADFEISIVSAADSLREWWPWVNFGECIKIVRDAAGLSAAPLISRDWYLGDRSRLHNAFAVSLVLLGLVSLVLTYAWLGYPVLLRLAANVRTKTLPKSPPLEGWPKAGVGSGSCHIAGDGPDTPIAVLIAAYNEETEIQARLANLCEQDFPLEKVTVYVGVDGATDGTAQAARAGAVVAKDRGLRVRVYEQAARGGKVAMLKTLVALVDHECPTIGVLVFSDANTVFNTDALRPLLLPFADQSVGGVCGRLLLTATDGAQINAEGIYWRWENRLKGLESRLNSCLGANGAIYAVRRELFPRDIPDNTIVDDFVIGMKIREQGFRIIYEPAACATEPLPATVHEWRRRVRIGAGDFQALALCRRCLSPRYGWFAWMFMSHKVLRWLTPHLLIIGWLAALAGALQALHARQFGLASVGLGLSVGLPVAAAVACVIGRVRGANGSGVWIGFFHAVDHFATMQAAILAGSLRWLRGNLRGAWEPTPRGRGTTLQQGSTWQKAGRTEQKAGRTEQKAGRKM